MDDMATTAETTVQTKHLLIKLIDKLKMGRTDSETRKCRSMVIKKGKVSTQTIQIEGSPITSVTEKKRYLGKSYNMTLNETRRSRLCAGNHHRLNLFKIKSSRKKLFVLNNF